MRVCVTGSHSSGKTCLVGGCYCALLQMYPDDVAMIPETARRLTAQGFAMAKGTDCDPIAACVVTQLEAERLAVARHVISDRCTLDLLAYLRTSCNPEVPARFVSMVEEIAWLESRYFDIFCYVPIEFPMVSDAVRPDDEAYSPKGR